MEELDRVAINLEQFILEYSFMNERFKKKVDLCRTRKKAMIQYAVFAERELDSMRYSAVFDTVYELIDYLPQYRSYVEEYQALYAEMKDYIYEHIEK
jgi:hypothetical protein